MHIVAVVVQVAMVRGRWQRLDGKRTGAWHNWRRGRAGILFTLPVRVCSR